MSGFISRFRLYGSYDTLFTSLALACAVGMIIMSFRHTWGGRVMANKIVSAMSSLLNGVMPLYTFLAASASPL